MTTGATGQLGLALPVQGELSGTWGDTVNNGITQYTNIAIAATLTLTNDGAVTLANTTGDASATNITSSLTGAGTVTAQFAIVKVTGTLTTAKVITAPSYSKTYVVVNAATGGIVTFKASGQTGVSIAVGESAWVYYNGTDYVKIVGTATAGAAGGSNTQVQFNSSGSLAGSSNLTFDGTNLTLGGGTANGVTYLNGSKVLTSGSALTFDGTNFATTGAGTFSGLLSRIHAQGTDAYITNTTTGKANTVMGFNDSGSTTAQGIPTGYSYYGTLQSYPIGFTSGGYLTNSISSTAHIWNTTGTEQMRLTSTGLGIGTSSPASKLQVTSANGAVTLDSGTGESHYIDITHKGSYSDLGGIRFNQGSTTYGNNQILFRAMDSGGTVQTVMTLNGAGNLALGTTPSAWGSGWKGFDIGSGAGVSSTSNTIYLSGNAYNNGTNWKYINSASSGMYYISGNTHAWHVASSGTAGNTITFTQAMTLDASGNLSLDGGGTYSVNNTKAYQVKDSGGTNRYALYMSGGVSPTAGNDLYLGNTLANALVLFTNGTERARISSAGGFSVGTTADPGAGAIYATGNITAYYSDDRLKTRLGNIENALDKVEQLQGFYYEANETAQALGYKVKREVGVSAQSVQAVLPEIVSPAPIDQQYLTVDYERLVPLLIEAVKELTAKVKALEAK